MKPSLYRPLAVLALVAIGCACAIASAAGVELSALGVPVDGNLAGLSFGLAGATFTETATRVGDVLKREYDKLYNRETITIASGNNLKLGAVVGKITASGKYAAYDDAAVDGTAVAGGILLEDVDASAADAKGVILARGPAVLARSFMVYADGTADADKTAAEVDLLALGIVTRTDIGRAA